jgi:hypothetical protein
MENHSLHREAHIAKLLSEEFQLRDAPALAKVRPFEVHQASLPSNLAHHFDYFLHQPAALQPLSSQSLPLKTVALV